MALDFQDRFNGIVAKANLLAQRYKILLEKKNELESIANALQAQVDDQAKELQSLRQEVEYLRMAAVLSPDREQVEATRAVISSLVRDIDRCITDLSD